MPTNLYGPGDNFNLKGSHVLPAMIRKFHEGKLSGAPSIELWGTGGDPPIRVSGLFRSFLCRIGSAV